MRTWLKLVVVVVAVLASGCTPSEVSGQSILVVGDSIGHSASDETRAALAGNDVSIHAYPGIDLVDGRTHLLLPHLSTNPDVVVVELGINSAREVWDESDASAVDQILADVADVPCVVWITPTALSPSYYDHLGEGTLASRLGQMKRSIQRRAVAYPNVVVADFGAVEVANPSWFEADRLHLLQAGQDAFADFVVQSIEQTSCG